MLVRLLRRASILSSQVTVGSCAFGLGALSLAFPGFARFVGALRNPSVGEWFLLIPLFCLSECQIVFVCTVYPGLCINTYYLQLYCTSNIAVNTCEGG